MFQTDLCISEINSYFIWYQANFFVCSVTRSKGKQLMTQSLKKEKDGHPVKYAGLDAFPRTLLLLNPLQMAQENYPLPVKTENGKLSY